MNSYVVPDFVCNVVAKAVNRFRPREPVPLHTLANAVLIGPTPAQMNQKQRAEAALTKICDASLEIEAAALSLGLNIDNELRSLLGKTYKARKKAAHDIYVKTAIED